MVVIRLARHGRHKYPTYRIVAADKRRAATGKFLAILGTYNPHTKEISLKKEEILTYIANGAQASDRVLRLLKNEGVELPAWAKTHDRNKKPKKEVEETPETNESTEEATLVEGGAEGEEATAEVAADEASAAEEKAEEIKEDTGTAAEADDKSAEAETTEKVANAVEETVEAKADDKESEDKKA